jgi:uncharacterized RDD family membrane protein YckC
MSTPVDQFQRDKRLQEHWIRRFVAIIIDIIIIWAIAWVIMLVLAFSTVFFYRYHFFFSWWFLPWVIFLLYASFLEGTTGSTIGKKLLRLKVVPLREKLDMRKALIRNISKIFFLLLLLDVLLAFFTAGDPRQRYLDRIAETCVIDIGTPQMQPGKQPWVQTKIESQ